MPKTLPGRRIRGVTDQPDFSLETWPTPDVGSLPPKVQDSYFKRKRAVELCIEGASNKKIMAECGIGLRQATRLITERCAAPSPDGRIFGFRALVLYVRLFPAVRKKPVVIDKFGHGGTGAMGSLLLGDPAFKTKLDSKILRTHKSDELTEGKRHRQAIWGWFLDELRDRGYEIRKEWPFNSEGLGYQALLRYTDKLLKTNPAVLALIAGGTYAARKLRAGDGVDRPTFKPYGRVEMDAHKLDGRFCVLLPAPGGGWVPRIIHRLWVIVMVEVISRAVIGYYLSTRKEVSKDDVLRTIKSSLTKWTAFDTTHSENPLAEGAGLPSVLGDEFIGLCWDELSVDGALAETCKTVKETLANVVGSDLLSPQNSFSARRSLDDRPYIESLFRALGNRGLQRLSNTTGSSNKDPRKNNPEGVAIESQFTIEFLAELLQSLICNYNAAKHSSLGYMSPLQKLDHFRQQGMLPKRRADSTLVQSMLSYRKLCVVHGGAAEGRAPYINFDHGRYGGPAIADREDLVGTKVWMVNHLEDDARIARCTTTDGKLIGVLRAAPPWDKLPHSLAVRRSIKTLHKDKRIQSLNNDGIRTFMKFVDAQTNKKLPVHPAYLEIQRILAQQASSFEGDGAAKRALESLGTLHTAPLTKEADSQPGHSSTPVIPTVVRPANTAKKPLPAKRLAKN
ncbi:MAG: hypothetical protein KJ731_20770 [Alphaproteobacteria bacterium]|jgi:hypothetical protein|nr:hypothetical protein [Alphaproteobacteria bacterium]